MDEIQRVHPVLDYDFQKVNNPPQDKIQITWIGHATVLVQIEGMNILADPVFSEKCGPAGFGLQLGYTRFRCPACQVEDLPPIHVVLISHNHHDHLDSQSVKDIAQLYSGAKWLVGLGNAKFCKKHGCKDVKELKWWEPTTVGAFTFVCTPTQHWCQRYPLDFNHALWCGWVVKSPNYKYYFAGDTGYQGELFKLIGRKYGPFDLASIPIGAYHPRYITEFQHVNPEEAVEVHKDIQSKISVGMHWGTFELTNEYYLEPPQRLEKQMKKEKLDLKTFFNLRIGETWVVGENRDYNPPFMEREKEKTQTLSDDPPTQRPDDDPSTQKLGDDSPTQKHGDDPSTQSQGDDPSTQRHSDDSPTQRHGDDPPTQSHGDDPPTQRHDDDPPTQRHGGDPSTQIHGDDPSTQSHGDDPSTQRHSDDPSTQRHGDDPSTQRHGDDPSAQRPSNDPSTQSHGDDPPTQRHGDDPSTQSHGDDPPTQRHGDDPSTQSHGDDPPTQRHGDDPPTQRHGDDPPTQRHGDDPPTQRHGDDPPTQSHGNLYDDPLTQ
ncbi:N-acyl-phosphatidylethanolamine-hydrolyzing phospholipase D-like [Mya arenaria]|uniref:N-acyl-phosphatidylethanolamine-hydrolyzing phospholipase D-like n=1 Tax=Mya arenaria TaxID=6604 RepID=UPI0022E88EE0|nr:N-acyl-phosphatidylethanolamine-hydrolyzing phospholipase D-like [Mya arenaria]